MKSIKINAVAKFTNGISINPFVFCRVKFTNRIFEIPFVFFGVPAPPAKVPHRIWLKCAVF